MARSQQPRRESPELEPEPEPELEPPREEPPAEAPPELPPSPPESQGLPPPQPGRVQPGGIISTRNGVPPS